MTMIKRKSILPGFPMNFDDFFTKDLFDWGFQNNSLTDTTLPSVNIVEKTDEFIVEMAAPGMEKKDFHIELDNEILTISSEKELEDEMKETDRFVRREYSYQAFKRTFHLPKTVVDDAKIEANYRNGVLKVMIPKKEEAKKLPPKQILIK